MVSNPAAFQARKSEKLSPCISSHESEEKARTSQEHGHVSVHFCAKDLRWLAYALSRQPRTQETISVRLSLLELAVNPGSTSAMAGLRKSFAAGREWFAGIRADLEALGYACGGADLCAAGVRAPHIRQRLYWMADAHGGDASPEWKQPGREHRQFPSNDGNPSRLSNAASIEARPAQPTDCGDETDIGWPNGSSPTGRFVDADGCVYRIPEPFIPFVAYGVPGILDQISAAGNAIVPQVAAEFISAYCG